MDNSSTNGHACGENEHTLVYTPDAVLSFLVFLRFLPPFAAVLVTAFLDPFLGAGFAGSGMVS